MLRTSSALEQARDQSSIRVRLERKISSTSGCSVHDPPEPKDPRPALDLARLIGRLQAEPITRALLIWPDAALGRALSASACRCLSITPDPGEPRSGAVDGPWPVEVTDHSRRQRCGRQ